MLEFTKKVIITRLLNSNLILKTFSNNNLKKDSEYLYQLVLLWYSFQLGKVDKSIFK